MQLPGFLRLPYEMREMIYKLLFISNQWIIVETRSAHPARRNKLYCYKLSKVWVGCPDMGWSGQLLRVCKLFHTEGTEFLYRHNKFEMSLQTLQQTFLPTIGKRNASYIRYMEIARTALGKSVATRTIPALLKALPNLRCLYFTPVQEKCNHECQKYCKHKPSYLRILVLRLAQLATTTHPHLTQFLEFKCAANRRLTMVWFKFSDQDSGRHPPRPHEHPDYVHQLSNPRPRYGSDVAGQVVDIEKQLTRIKLVKVPSGRHVQRNPVPIAERPAWRL